MRRRILVLAEHRIGHGNGHMYRCARLVPLLDGEVEWLLPEKAQPGFRSRDEMRATSAAPGNSVRWIDKPTGRYDLAILDKRESDRTELESLGDVAMTIGIDLGGEARDYCSYLIDTLPTAPGVQSPNVADAGLLTLPSAVSDQWPSEPKRVLIVFGGESDGRDAVAAARELAEMTGLSVTAAVQRTVDVVSGDVAQLVAPGDLAEHLWEFDLVVTHFGLTAYEAAWARCPVICINPSRYHELLANQAGLVCADDIPAVAKSLERFERVVERTKSVRPTGRADLAALINTLAVPDRTTPPSGGERLQPARERYAERTFFENRHDNLYFQTNYRGVEVRYNHDYFFQEYRDQYGRTYLEDFEHIAAIGGRRLDDIERVRSHRLKGAKLLDIGCAYGPFIKTAAERGCRVCGVDVSCDAVDYAREELGLTAVCTDIRQIDPNEIDAPFDVVTMWYVIEHFVDLDDVLPTVRSLIVPGGTFAFSTPNIAGISGRSDRREFLRRSPDDHYTIWSPESARKVLKRFGFVVKSVRVTGHHPERFKNLPVTPQRLERGAIRSAVALWSRLRGLGDTFEVVAEAC